MDLRRARLREKTPSRSPASNTSSTGFGGACDKASASRREKEKMVWIIRLREILNRRQWCAW